MKFLLGLEWFIHNIGFLFKTKLKDEFKKRDSLFLKMQDCAALEGKIAIDLKNSFYNLKTPNIKNNEETIALLNSTQKSFIRFGDGEFFLICGQGIAFQEYDPKLAQILKEILLSSDENLLCGLPNFFHINFENSELAAFHRNYNMQFLLPRFFDIYNLIKMDKIYGSAGVSASYIGNPNKNLDSYYNEIKKLWENKEVNFICGDLVFKNISFNILENAKKINYIHGPACHAFREFEPLLERVLALPKDNLLIFALGPCGKALAYYAHKNGYRALDLGHLFQDYNAYKMKFNISVESSAEFFAPDTKENKKF